MLACGMATGFREKQSVALSAGRKDDVRKRAEVCAIFKQYPVEALTRVVRQAHWLETAGLLIGPRTGGDGNCPLCAALGHGLTDETHEHRLCDCPCSQQVWRHVLQAWLVLFPGLVNTARSELYYVLYVLYYIMY